MLNGSSILVRSILNDPANPQLTAFPAFPPPQRNLTPLKPERRSLRPDNSWGREIDAKTSADVPDHGDVYDDTASGIAEASACPHDCSGFSLSISVCASSRVERCRRRHRIHAGSDRSRPPARNVLQHQRRPGKARPSARSRARRHSACRLTPSECRHRCSRQQRRRPPLGKEPFGLFTFRAPEGILWRKWRGIEADMAKEQTVLDRCREDAARCPSHAAQFLRLINAVKAKSGRDKLEEANRAVNMAIRYVSDYRPARRSRPVELRRLPPLRPPKATARITPSPNMSR